MAHLWNLNMELFNIQSDHFFIYFFGSIFIGLITNRLGENMFLLINDIIGILEDLPRMTSKQF